jgi:hypothetical protein
MRLEPLKDGRHCHLQSWWWNQSFESHGVHIQNRRRLKPTTSFFKCHLQVWTFLFLKDGDMRQKLNFIRGQKLMGIRKTVNRQR